MDSQTRWNDIVDLIQLLQNLTEDSAAQELIKSSLVLSLFRLAAWVDNGGSIPTIQIINNVPHARES